MGLRSVPRTVDVGYCCAIWCKSNMRFIEGRGTEFNGLDSSSGRDVKHVLRVVEGCEV